MCHGARGARLFMYKFYLLLPMSLRLCLSLIVSATKLKLFVIRAKTH